VNYSEGSWKVDIQAVMLGDKYKVSLSSEQLNASIRYTLDGSDPTNESMEYAEPLMIEYSTLIKAGLFKEGQLKEKFSEKEIVFHKGIGKRGVLQEEPSSYYAGRGALSLIDGFKGSDNFRDGYWLGFSGSDFQFELDLEKPTLVEEVSVNFLQNVKAWIFMPQEVVVAIYTEERVKVAEQSIKPEATWEVKGTIIEEFKADFQQPEARFIQIKAKNIKSIPEWHEGAGNEGWLFIDEVIIK